MEAVYSVELENQYDREATRAIRKNLHASSYHCFQSCISESLLLVTTKTYYINLQKIERMLKVVRGNGDNISTNEEIWSEVVLRRIDQSNKELIVTFKKEYKETRNTTKKDNEEKTNELQEPTELLKDAAEEKPKE